MTKFVILSKFYRTLSSLFLFLVKYGTALSSFLLHVWTMNQLIIESYRFDIDKLKHTVSG